MKSILKGILFLSLAGMIACGPTELEKKKAKLKKYKKEVLALNGKITNLEQEIASLDPEFAKANREATLVTTMPVKTGRFEHFVEVSGSVESHKNITLSSEMIGSIQNIYVEEGDNIRKGQVLIKLDDKVLQNSINEVKTSLELAETVFERQSNLWEQNIGTEIQYLEAKNNVASLKSKLSTLQSQMEKAVIRAPFNGSIDKTFIKEGEMAQPGVPLVRIVSLEDMYIEADLSESFVGKFKKGQDVEVEFPSLNAVFTSKLSAVGQVIDKNNRTFSIEVELPKNGYTPKPNLIAILRLKDFEKENAVVVPTNLIQIDNQGDFIYVMENADSLNIAKKVQVKRGATYKDHTMIEEGLTGNETLIDEGNREVAEGHIVKVVDATIL